MIRPKKFRIGMAAVLLWMILSASVTSAVFAIRLALFGITPTAASQPSSTVLIRAGTGARSVASMLAKQGIVRDAELFYWYARARRLADKMQAGEYQFPRIISPNLVLETLVQGKVVVHKVTFPEGVTLKDVARIVAGAGLADPNDILELAQDRHLMASLDVHNATSLEGYLFPATYVFRRTDRPRDVLRRMVMEFWRRFSPERQTKARQMGFTIHEAVTLASLVEKEAVIDAERPVIAGVFLNRLRRDMPLQSDPTAVYDLSDFEGPILRRHLERKSPYNTYIHKGLPPGPICNPGEKSLRAVVEPKKIPYLYFVSNNDGSHTFSTTYEEHLQAVARYRSVKQENQNGRNPLPEDSGAEVIP